MEYITIQGVRIALHPTTVVSKSRSYSFPELITSKAITDSECTRIWIASCPGENLPTFPRPTNGGDRRLPDPITLRDVLRQIQSSRHRDPLHDVELSE